MAPLTEQVFASQSTEAYNGGVQNATARREPPVAWPKLGKEFDMSNDTPLRDSLSNRLGGPHKLCDLMPLVLAQFAACDDEEESEAPASDGE